MRTIPDIGSDEDVPRRLYYTDVNIQCSLTNNFAQTLLLKAPTQSFGLKFLFKVSILSSKATSKADDVKTAAILYRQRTLLSCPGLSL